MIMDAGRLGSPFGMARSGQESVTLRGTNTLGSLEGFGLSLRSLCPGQEESQVSETKDAGISIFEFPVLSSINPCLITRRDIWLTAALGEATR